jgi:hypothetical protein
VPCWLRDEIDKVKKEREVCRAAVRCTALQKQFYFINLFFSYTKSSVAGKFKRFKLMAILVFVK